MILEICMAVVFVSWIGGTSLLFWRAFKTQHGLLAETIRLLASRNPTDFAAITHTVEPDNVVNRVQRDNAYRQAVEEEAERRIAAMIDNSPHNEVGPS